MLTSQLKNSFREMVLQENTNWWELKLMFRAFTAKLPTTGNKRTRVKVWPWRIGTSQEPELWAQGVRAKPSSAVQQLGFQNASSLTHLALVSPFPKWSLQWHLPHRVVMRIMMFLINFYWSRVALQYWLSFCVQQSESDIHFVPIYILFFGFPFPLGHHRALSRAACAGWIGMDT